jgi:hypothetical protein
MSNKSDKPYVRNWIIASVVVILIFHLAWAKYLALNYSRPFFAIVDVLVLVAFAGASYVAYNKADDPSHDVWRKAFIALAVVSSIWAAAWSTGLMNNMNQGL